MTTSTLSWLRTLMVRELRSLSRELELFPDDDTVWTTLPGVTNSAGTLALHLCGNLHHFVGAVLGQTGYVRDRDHEFGATGIPRTELDAQIDATIGMVESVLPQLAASDLDAEYPLHLAGQRMVTGQFLLHLGHHLAFHVGQVGYLRRILTGDGQTSGAVGLQSLAIDG